MTEAATAAAPAYLLVESQAGHTSDLFLRDGVALARSGADVCVFLVADAVWAAIDGVAPAVAELTAADGRLWVDDFTVAQRAVPTESLVDGAAVVGMDRVASLLADKRLRVVWH